MVAAYDRHHPILLVQARLAGGQNRQRECARAVLAAYGLAPDTPEPEIVAHLFELYAEATEGTKRTEGTKETKETEATKGGGQSLKSLPSLSSLEGGSNG